MNTLILTSSNWDSRPLIEELHAAGHTVHTAPTPEAACAYVQTETVTHVFLTAPNLTQKDHTNLTRKTISQLRAAAPNYLYIVTLHKDQTNTHHTTPFTPHLGENATHTHNTITPHTLNALHSNQTTLTQTIHTIGNNAIDFPSAGGIIARSAFNQLFLSTLDRSNRHGELSAILAISITNYDDLFKIGGNYVADYALATLSQRLVQIRRQSDIIGQIRNNSFSLLLHTPKNPQEPINAANRFAHTLEQDQQLQNAAPIALSVTVSLMTIPTGETTTHHTLSIAAQPVNGESSAQL